MNKNYKDKKSDYFSGARNVILDLVPESVNRVLEIGCGYGKTLLMLKEKALCNETVGIELVESVAYDAQKKGNVDKIYAIDVEKAELPSELGKFDLILLLDVLEHLVDPWSLLYKLNRNYLLEKGKVIISLPNARHFSLVLPLLLGRFDYTESGILDKTHLRFFTNKSAIALVKSAELNVEKIKTESLRLNLNMGKFNYVTFGVFSGFIATHYIFLCGKK